MAELQIYDSQGLPIRGGPGGENQQVKDFFFDGVRIAVDANRNEMFCFFRARDNDTARSEQYYAKYTYQTRSEMNGLYQKVQSRIEGEYGMILDTENEDTRFFELLGSAESGRTPDSSDLDDVASLLSNYESARIGVGSYREAYGLFGDLFDNDGVSKIAVSDNATGRSLSAYDLVIEKGDYFGLELLGDTEDKVESLREQRRSAFETEYGTEDDNDPISGLMGAALFGGLGVVLVLAVVYGSCLGVGMALIGDPPGVNSCGPYPGSVSADVTENSSQAIQITGVINSPALLSDVSDTNETVNVTVSHENGTELFNSSGKRRLNSSGGFDFTVQPEGNATTLAPGNYTASVEYDGKTANASFVVGNGSASSGTTNQTANDTTSPTAENDSTAGGSIDSISVSTVNNTAGSVQVNGTATGLANRAVSLLVNITSANDSSVSSNESNVTVEQDGTFALSVPFDANGTPGPYEVSVRYNGSVTNATFGSSPAAEPKLENVTLLTVDAGEAKISFKGNISNFTGERDQQLTIRLENETSTSTVYESGVPVEVDDDGSFQVPSGVSVSDSGSLPDGEYTFIVTYDDGAPVEVAFSVPQAG